MKIQKLFNKIAFQTPISISLLISFIGLYLCAFFSCIWILFVSVLISCAVAIFGHLWSREEFSEADRFTVKLVLGLCALTTASLVSFAVRTLIKEGIRRSVIATLICAVGFLALFLLELRFYLRVVPKIYSGTPRKMTLRTILPICAVCGAVLLLSLENFGVWIRWDSYDYYYYFKNLSYSGLTVIDNLRPANHAAYGASVIYLLLDGIIGNAKVTLLLINILMLLVGTYAFWRILEKQYSHWSPWARACCASIYAFSPFLFGLSWSINLEAFLIFGLVLYFWGKVEGLSVIQTAAALLICFSKEIGAVLLAAIVASHLMMNLFSKKDGRTVVAKLELQLSLPILGYGIVWLCDFLLNSWVSSNSLRIQTIIPGMPFNAFGFNVLYILDRFASLIFTNFSWLLLSLVGAGFIAGIVRKKHSQSKERREYLVEVTVGAAASLIPLFLFVTYNHIRYAGPTVILVLLLLPEALDRLFVGIKWRVIVCGALAALSLLQCYLTVDPMMHLVCGELNKGKGKVAFANNYILVNGTTASSISVDSQYNREMMYFDFAIDAILEDIEYGSDTILIISDEYFEPTIGGYVGAEYLIMGFGYSYMENPKYVAWDADREMRYLSDSPHYAINVYYTNNQANISKAIDRYARCIYISLPFKDQAKQNEVFSNFNVTEIKTGNYYGWQLSAYELTDRG